jgi:hypothetical protein
MAVTVISCKTQSAKAFLENFVHPGPSGSKLVEGSHRGLIFPRELEGRVSDLLREELAGRLHEVQKGPATASLAVLDA